MENLEQVAEEKEKVRKAHILRQSAGKDKDFAVAAAKRRKAKEQIEAAELEIKRLKQEEADLLLVLRDVKWVRLFATVTDCLKCQKRLFSRVTQLDFSGCGLH